ncbi:multiheme c-type cytochrome [Campylobacter corcagiensis]|uniref:multiheme c-type cytochrome n=1 Tax=Campylobacter corcagiensis TaxID=1448857 RepID=UPI000470B55C|nr:multiheme c-type cytochrome [Campylobacter corcagiensis]QKF64338.1 putative cytochrome c [Campylobacter corcagiensis]
MKFFLKSSLLILALVSYINASSAITHRFIDPNNCKTCHEEQFGMWKTSLHAISHENNNPLFRAAVRLVSSETHKPYDEVLISCANCHNPRLEIKNVDETFIIAQAFGIETESTKKAQNALEATHIQNGISCYICHNVDNISNIGVGYQNFSWTKGDEIAGPYDDPKNRAGFHTSVSREHFKSGNDLCLSCHQGKGLANELSTYNTGNEYLSSKDTQRCVDCHMGEPKQGIISPLIKPNDAVKRDIRDHLFAGARNNKQLLTDAIDAEISINSNEATLTVSNLISHNFPTGFSGRSLIAQISYLDSDKKEIKKENIEFKKVYLNKMGVNTLSYSAQNLQSDTTLKPYESREFKLLLPDNTKNISVSFIYYVLDPALQNRIIVDDDKFTKPYIIKNLEF